MAYLPLITDARHPLINQKIFLMRLRFLSFVTAILALTVLPSFTTTFGGDSYEIYIGGKRIVQHNVHNSSRVPIVALSKEDSGEQLSVTYSHCGEIGTMRSITISTENGAEKKWSFNDGSNTANMVSSGRKMSISISDLLAMKKKAGNGNLELRYFSKEIPKGKLLAYLK